jgi:glycosyltransferase involved in cell wall biosynthesis
MEYPDLTVLIVTFDRPKEIRAVIEALQRRINYHGKVHWHIADDGTPGTYLPDLYQDFRELHFTATQTQRKGWGANVNKALRHIRDDYIFLCEDDYVAKRPINLNRGVAVLESQPELGLIRYDGISGHIGIRLTVREARSGAGVVDYLELDLNHSGHLNCYSNRPHLRHRRFHDTVGYYAEGRPLGVTEEGYAHRVLDADPQSGIAVLGDGVARAFDHIGKSRQGTEFDHPY